MKPNLIRERWQNDQPVINAWLSIANPFSAEIVARQGYDSVTIDTQHGIVGYADMVSMLQALQGAPATPLVRVPWLDPAAIMKALDAGAAGIICPMVNTREQAEQLVSWMRYPPLGLRSFGPTRAVFSEGSDYYSNANAHVLAIAMIETTEAMSNLEAIVSTPGLDAVYIGPADLTISLSNGNLLPGMDREEPEMIEAIRKIQQAASNAGIRACLHTASPAYAARGIEWGFNLVTLTNDVRLLAASAAREVQEMRALLSR